MTAMRDWDIVFVVNSQPQSAEQQPQPGSSRLRRMCNQIALVCARGRAQGARRRAGVGGVVGSVTQVDMMIGPLPLPLPQWPLDSCGAGGVLLSACTYAGGVVGAEAVVVLAAALRSDRRRPAQQQRRSHNHQQQQ